MHESSHGRDRIASLLDRLDREYGDVPIVEKTWRVSPAAYEHHRDRIDAGTDGGAGLWLTDDEGRVLLVRNEGDEGWADPGGKVEGEESFEAAAKRETREETGVEGAITGLCEVHLIEMRDETDPNRPRPVTPIVVFRAEYVAGDPRPREGEIAAVDWFAAPPETVLYEEVATRAYPAGE